LKPIDFAGASGEVELSDDDVAELGMGNAGGVRTSPRTMEMVWGVPFYEKELAGGQ
jgi:hypothetical protein